MGSTIFIDTLLALSKCIIAAKSDAKAQIYFDIDQSPVRELSEALLRTIAEDVRHHKGRSAEASAVAQHVSLVCQIHTICSADDTIASSLEIFNDISRLIISKMLVQRIARLDMRLAATVDRCTTLSTSLKIYTNEMKVFRQNTESFREAKIFSQFEYILHYKARLRCRMLAAMLARLNSVEVVKAQISQFLSEGDFVHARKAHHNMAESIAGISHCMQQYYKTFANTDASSRQGHPTVASIHRISALLTEDLNSPVSYTDLLRVYLANSFELHDLTDRGTHKSTLGSAMYNNTLAADPCRVLETFRENALVDDFLALVQPALMLFLANVKKEVNCRCQIRDDKNRHVFAYTILLRILLAKLKLHGLLRHVVDSVPRFPETSSMAEAYRQIAKSLLEGIPRVDGAVVEILETVLHSRHSNFYRPFARSITVLHGILSILKLILIVTGCLYSQALFHRVLHIVCTSTTKDVITDKEQGELLAVVNSWSDTCHTLCDIHEHMLSHVQRSIVEADVLSLRGLPDELYHESAGSMGAALRLSDLHTSDLPGETATHTPLGRNDVTGIIPTQCASSLPYTHCTSYASMHTGITPYASSAKQDESIALQAVISYLQGFHGDSSKKETTEKNAQTAPKQRQGPSNKSLMRDLKLYGNQFVNAASGAVTPVSRAYSLRSSYTTPEASGDSTDAITVALNTFLTRKNEEIAEAVAAYPDCVGWVDTTAAPTGNAVRSMPSIIATLFENIAFTKRILRVPKQVFQYAHISGRALTPGAVLDALVLKREASKQVSPSPNIIGDPSLAEKGQTRRRRRVSNMGGFGHCSSYSTSSGIQTRSQGIVGEAANEATPSAFSTPQLEMYLTPKAPGSRLKKTATKSITLSPDDNEGIFLTPTQKTGISVRDLHKIPFLELGGTFASSLVDMVQQIPYNSPEKRLREAKVCISASYILTPLELVVSVLKMGDSGTDISRILLAPVVSENDSRAPERSDPSQETLQLPLDVSAMYAAAVQEWTHWAANIDNLSLKCTEVARRTVELILNAPLSSAWFVRQSILPALKESSCVTVAAHKHLTVREMHTQRTIQAVQDILFEAVCLILSGLELGLPPGDCSVHALLEHLAAQLKKKFAPYTTAEHYAGETSTQSQKAFLSDDSRKHAISKKRVSLLRKIFLAFEFLALLLVIVGELFSAHSPSTIFPRAIAVGVYTLLPSLSQCDDLWDRSAVDRVLAPVISSVSNLLTVFSTISVYLAFDFSRICFHVRHKYPNLYSGCPSSGDCSQTLFSSHFVKHLKGIFASLQCLVLSEPEEVAGHTLDAVDNPSLFAVAFWRNVSQCAFESLTTHFSLCGQCSSSGRTSMLFDFFAIRDYFSKPGRLPKYCFTDGALPCSLQPELYIQGYFLGPSAFVRFAIKHTEYSLEKIKKLLETGLDEGLQYSEQRYLWEQIVSGRQAQATQVSP